MGSEMGEREWVKCGKRKEGWARGQRLGVDGQGDGDWGGVAKEKEVRGGWTRGLKLRVDRQEDSNGLDEQGDRDQCEWTRGQRIGTHGPGRRDWECHKG